MVQGTCSAAGKSLLVAALCRLFREESLRVAPFKSQNLSLNAFVTAEGLEMGRAQAMQAEAAGVRPTAEMNPILLKPEHGGRCQIILLGRPVANIHFGEYEQWKPMLTQAIADSLSKLRRTHDLIVIEGAGSPVELNLQSRDLANMYVAQLADAPVLLVGDAERGGVFASLVGTLALLPPEDRRRVAGLIINKLHGGRELLGEGVRLLEHHAGVPLLGVVPYIERVLIPDEDVSALGVGGRMSTRRAPVDALEIAIVRLPHMSNHDEFQPLEHEPGVVLRFVDEARELEGADLVILPGSKSTVADLRWARDVGIADVIQRRAARGEPLLGICGGCQMLGEWIEDPEHVESTQDRFPGLGILPVSTHFQAVKRTTQVQVRQATNALLGTPGMRGSGYEIHMGRLRRMGGEPLLIIEQRNGQPCGEADGAVAHSGAVMGTMVHGLLEDKLLRAGLLERLRQRRGLAAPAVSTSASVPSSEREFARLADIVRSALSLERLRSIIGLSVG
jgi:adenosylcobyric acid synthase